MHSEPFVIIYGLRDREAFDLALLHRRWWGKRETQIEHLGDDRVVLTFHPASNRKRWERFEEVRRGWILEGVGAPACKGEDLARG